jgi:hypothetical protein
MAANKANRAFAGLKRRPIEKDGTCDIGCKSCVGRELGPSFAPFGKRVARGNLTPALSQNRT